MDVRTVGVLGLGTMGRPVARRMMAAGYEVVGFDPCQEAVARALELGVAIAASPAEIACACDMAIVLVGFQEQVDDVIFGGQGLMTAARSGLVIGVSSTVSPSYARGLAARLVGRDVALLDMPTTRSEKAAHAGALLVLTGGDPEVFQACRPVMETFASDIFHLGPFGCGQVGKMINNMILWACTAANVESLQLGEKLGVDQARLRTALKKSSAANFSLIEDADFTPMTWAEKDMAIAQHEADACRFSMPLGGLVKEVVKAIKLDRGYPTPTL